MRLLRGDIRSILSYGYRSGYGYGYGNGDRTAVGLETIKVTEIDTDKINNKGDKK
jgi:hypothetical protein